MGTNRYDEADDRQMRAAQKALVDALMPFTASTPSWLLCLALTRVLRVLLRKATKKQRDELLPTLFAYLRGDTQAPADKGLIWTPGDDDPRLIN